MDLLAGVSSELGAANAQVQREVALAPGVRVDAVLRTRTHAYVVEARSRPARPEDVAWVAFARQLLARAEKDRVVVAVLVVPGAGHHVRQLAAEAGVELLEVSPALLPRDSERIGSTPLATEQSWAVVVALLKFQRVPGVRELARRAGVSVGWTHRVVTELVARRALAHRGALLVLDGATPVLDAVASERPLSGLEVAHVDTGFERPEDLALHLTLGSRDLPAHEKPDVCVGGTTAAAWYTGYLIQRDRFDVYSEDPQPLEGLFRGRSGGLRLRVHEPDRKLGPGSTILGGLPAVRREQALLDVAGTGLAFRDLTLRLLEALRA